MLNIRMGRPFKSAPVCALLLGMLISSVPASAQFRRNTNNGAILYRDPNFSGPSRTFRTDVADLRPYGLNDQVSSIEIPPGETWEVCQDIDYGNGCQTLTSSVPDLRTIGLDDSISSVRRIDAGYQNGGYQNGPYRNGDYQNGQYSNGDYQYGAFGSEQQAQDELVLYDRPGFRGAAIVMTRDAYDQGARVNRRAASVAVRGGTWQLCDRTGRCASVSEGVSDLSQLGLNAQITSVRPVDNSWQRGDRQDGYFGNYRR